MKKWIPIVMMCLFAILVVNNPLSGHYIQQLKGEAITVAKEQDPLYEEVVRKSKNFYVKPSDAYIDPVWKAIPGLNGVEVDIAASYKKMKKIGKYDENKLVFKQIKPNVHLSDLPPAAIYKGNPNKPMVSFIINVAWGNEYLPDILETLKNHNVHASFFLEGRWVKNHPDLAKMIVAAGHEVGNHSYTHPDMKQISAGKIREEIIKTNDVIEATTEQVSRWLAPPSGSYRDEVVQIAAEQKLGTVMWSVDTIDWRKPSPDELINRVMNKVHNGAMILMHPTDSTAKALDELITQIEKKQLEIDTVSELLSEDQVLKNVMKNKSYLGKDKDE